MTDVVHIDDEPALCRIFKRILTRAGYSVEAFTNPLEGLAFVNATAPKLIICDLRMPQLSGTELFERLEVVVPFILISGDLNISKEATDGFSALLAKPVSPEQLLNIVAEFAGPPSR